MSSAAYHEYRKAVWQRFMRIAAETYFTRVGNIYLMQNSFMHTVMESCSSAQMEYLEEYFRASSLTQPITQKSALIFFSFSLCTNQHFRVLIATIKDMGSCPCPRCLMPKASFDLVGLFRDMQDRVTNLRTYCLENVMKARGFIYKSGNTVNGSKVQTTVGEGSWVPTVVSVCNQSFYD
jgi:hypothetical protein